jgi:ribA/ribD-fused uncharacterized protein
MPEPQIIFSFMGEHRFLSNFWPARVIFEGETYPSVEHAYQAAKTLNKVERRRIRDLPTARAAKYAGRHLELRPDWDQVKLGIMEQLLKSKFSDPDLDVALRKLRGVELIEGNWWGDTYWGVCNGVGENHLGKLLMKIRDYLYP